MTTVRDLYIIAVLYFLFAFLWVSLTCDGYTCEGIKLIGVSLDILFSGSIVYAILQKKSYQYYLLAAVAISGLSSVLSRVFSNGEFPTAYIILVFYTLIVVLPKKE